MRGLSASRAEPVLKAGGAEMVTALRRGMKRVHVRRAAIEAADPTDDGSQQKRCHVDSLQLVVQTARRVINACEECLCPRDGTGDGGLE